MQFTFSTALLSAFFAPCLATIKLETSVHNEKENILSVSLKDVTNLADYAKTHDINVM
eukprot:Pgem_evm1s18674